ncbi:hypothetical protein [Actinomadura yumaensis]|uniref:Holin n=1 Tax=Actinomadura yumaensis TaxID=111807 RepID=A0ABW2CS70_9ACTN
MNDRLISIVRTLVPKGVGALVGWLALVGIDVPDDTSAPLVAALTVFLSFVAGSAYYIAVRAVEQKYPWVGALLGHTGNPGYGAASGSSPFAGGGTFPPYETKPDFRA